MGRGRWANPEPLSPRPPSPAPQAAPKRLENVLLSEGRRSISGKRPSRDMHIAFVREEAKAAEATLC